MTRKLTKKQQAAAEKAAAEAAAKRKARREKLFKHRGVVLLLGETVIKRYESLQAFHAENCQCNISTTSKRISKCVDGWLPDGMIARYEGDEYKEGRPLQTEKARQSDGDGVKAAMRRDLAESEAKIEAIYEAWRRGEIDVYQRNEQVCWLENHVRALRNRIKNKLVTD